MKWKPSTNSYTVCSFDCLFFHPLQVHLINLSWYCVVDVLFDRPILSRDLWSVLLSLDKDRIQSWPTSFLLVRCGWEEKLGRSFNNAMGLAVSCCFKMYTLPYYHTYPHCWHENTSTSTVTYFVTDLPDIFISSTASCKSCSTVLEARCKATGFQQRPCGLPHADLPSYSCTYTRWQQGN